MVGDAAALVVWTTTPWTLLANTGVAVHPELTYAVVDGMVVAEELVEAVFGDRGGDHPPDARARPDRASVPPTLRRRARTARQ